MSTQIRQNKTGTKKPRRRGFSDLLWIFPCVLFLLFPAVLAAQTPQSTTAQASEAGQEPAEVSEQVTVSLPNSYQMAMALATPESRERALLDLAAAAHVLSKTNGGDEVDHTALAQNFLDDRAWLQMLVDRHGWVRPHSSILDPAAWLVSEELRQHDLEEMTLVFPGRIPGAQSSTGKSPGGN